MKNLLLVISFALLTGCASKTVLLSNPSEMVGSWEGYWDGQWAVKFDVTQVNSGEYSVVYQWQELSEGPFHNKKFTFSSVSENTIDNGFISITLEQHDIYSAIAVGRFDQKRKARLKRVEPK